TEPGPADGPTVDRLAKDAVCCGDHQPEHHGAGDWCHRSTGTAEDDDRVDEEGHHRAVVVRVDVLLVHREQDSGHSAKHAANDQGLQLVREDVLAKAACQVLVLTHGGQHPAPRAA